MDCQIDKRNIVAITASCLGLLGVILMGAAMGEAKDSCCDGSSTIGDLKDCKACAIACLTDSDGYFVDYEGCCYETSKPPLEASMIMVACVLACILVTAALGEGMERCHACVQNCSACILATINLIGLACMVVVIVLTIQTQKNKENSTDMFGVTVKTCPTVSLVKILEVSGLAITALVFSALGQVLSCAVAFMSSSCCQPNEQKKGLLG